MLFKELLSGFVLNKQTNEKDYLNVFPDAVFVGRPRVVIAVESGLTWKPMSFFKC